MNGHYSNTRLTEDGLFPYSGCKKDQLRFLLKYAVLAPSHYNAQPWKFHLDEDGLDVLRDAGRVANTIDPQCRESTISCGAAIGMIEVAARYFGYHASVKYSGNEKSDIVARVELACTHDPSKRDVQLFKAIKHRQTNRNWFDEATVPDSIQESAIAFGQSIDVQLTFNNDDKLTGSFASLTAAAVREQQALPWIRLEFSSWLRSKFSFRYDGVTSFGFFSSNLPSPYTRTMAKWFNQGKQVGEFNRNKVTTGSPVLAAISTESDTIESWGNTGRLLSHLLLELTTVNLSASFMNQAIQEVKLRDSVKSLFECNNKPQLILRIGVANNVVSTPRIPIEDRMV